MSHSVRFLLIAAAGLLLTVGARADDPDPAGGAGAGEDERPGDTQPDDDSPPTPPAPADGAGAAIRRTSNPCPAISGIERLETWVFRVDGALLEDHLRLSRLRRDVQLSRHEDGLGHLDGYRIGLPRCSVFRALGMRTGDIVQEVNGLRFDSIWWPGMPGSVQTLEWTILRHHAVVHVTWQVTPAATLIVGGSVGGVRH